MFDLINHSSMLDTLLLKLLI